MWTAIQYVSSGLTLVAFIAAVVAYIYRKKISSTERLIRTANQDDRGKLVADALEVFRIDASNLTKEQQYEIAIEQIKNKSMRSKLLAYIITVIAILASVVLIYTINTTKTSMGSNIGSLDTPKIKIL